MPDDTRAAFEAWYYQALRKFAHDGGDPLRKCADGRYYYTEASVAWKAWQAQAAETQRWKSAALLMAREIESVGASFGSDEFLQVVREILEGAK